MSQFIKVQKAVPQGNGSKDYVDKIVNIDEISTIEKYDGREYSGCHTFRMINSESFHAVVDVDSLNKLL